MKKYVKRFAVTLIWLLLVPATKIICGIISLGIYVAMRCGLKGRKAFDVLEATSTLEAVSLPYCIKHGEKVRF